MPPCPLRLVSGSILLMVERKAIFVRKLYEPGSKIFKSVPMLCIGCKGRLETYVHLLARNLLFASGRHCLLRIAGHRFDELYPAESHGRPIFVNGDQAHALEAGSA